MPGNHAPMTREQRAERLGIDVADFGELREFSIDWGRTPVPPRVKVRAPGPDIGDDDAISLKEASDLIFRGHVSPATLLANKHLKTFKVGRSNFTTKRYIREMQDQCLDGRKVRGSITTAAENSGQSEMDKASSALAALNQTTRALKRSSSNTSLPSTSQRPAPPR